MKGKAMKKVELQSATREIKSLFLLTLLCADSPKSAFHSASGHFILGG